MIQPIATRARACGLFTILLGVFVLGSTSRARTDEISHYNGGLMNMRDFFVPDPGVYGAVYNYFYVSDRLNDSHGDKTRTVKIQPGPGPGTTVNVDVDIDLYAVAPALMWVLPWEPLGTKFGMYIVPSFMNTSLEGSLSTTKGRGADAGETTFGAGDLFVQPVWLGWGFKYWELAASYGFTAPVGRYDTDVFNVPGVGQVTAEAVDNIGLGFWTHQVQGAVAWYPLGNKGTAVTGAVTYEINTEKQDFDLRPGQNLTLNWGLSQYIPLAVDESLLLEVGPAGYDSWQVTDDRGHDAKNVDVHDQVHGVGGQIGLTYVPWGAVINFHGFYEYLSVDRFQGASFGVNLAIKL